MNSLQYSSVKTTDVDDTKTHDSHDFTIEEQEEEDYDYTPTPIQCWWIVALCTCGVTLTAILIHVVRLIHHQHYPPRVNDWTPPKSLQPTISSHNQRVVLLAGPHKTGSSSIQENVMSWSRLGLLGNWTWAAPDTSLGAGSYLQGGKGKKVFSPMMNILSNRVVVSRTVPKLEAGRIQLLALYRDEFRRAWRQGRSIVIGAEGSDCMLNEANVQPQRFVDGFLSLMPWSSGDRRVRSLNDNVNETRLSDITPLHGSDQNLTVVITYRAPRVDHFLSAWHMFGNPPYLRNWTLEMDYDMHLLDPLGMAQGYADHGISVLIVDLSGTTHRNVDISDVIACDVLNVACENSVIVGNDRPPEIRNHMRLHKAQTTAKRTDMTPTELLKIDDIMNTFDCNYKQIVVDPNIQILYGHALLQNIERCPKDDDIQDKDGYYSIKTRDELRETIKMVARDGLGHVKMQFNRTVVPYIPYFVDLRDKNRNQTENKERKHGH